MITRHFDTRPFNSECKFYMVQIRADGTPFAYHGAYSIDAAENWAMKDARQFHRCEVYHVPDTTHRSDSKGNLISVFLYDETEEKVKRHGIFQTSAQLAYQNGQYALDFLNIGSVETATSYATRAAHWARVLMNECRVHGIQIACDPVTLRLYMGQPMISVDVRIC